jgi:o-succinylbenzoate synthase
MLSQLSLYTYELPLHSHFSIQETCRKGVVVESPGHHVFAEASPLPGYSAETDAEVLLQISSLLDTLIEFSTKPYSQARLVTFLKEAHLFPSVTFALYSLFEQIHSPTLTETVAPIRCYLDVPYESRFSTKTLLERIRAFTSHTVKIKLGCYPVQEAIALMEQAIKIPNTLFHLDINKKWSLDEVLSFCQHFPQGSFVALEDPTPDIESLWYLAQNSSHPIAVDHLLRTSSLDNLLHLPHLRSCEFKPTLDMHVLLDTDLLSSLRKKGVQITLSSAYETSIGLAAIGRLGVEYSSSDLGIDTLGVFKEDLLVSPLKRNSHHILIPPSLSVNKEKLNLYETTSLSRR